jgi:Secretory lipase
MKKYLFFIAISVLFVWASCRPLEDNSTPLNMIAESRGDIISSTLLLTLDSAQIKQRLLAASSAAGILPTKYTIDIYKIIYKTIDPFGKPTQASGLCIIPKGTPKVQGIASYQHGTITKKEDVPSRPDRSDESLIGMVLGTNLGLVVSMPDYLGLGDSPNMHPYIHAKSEASAGIDMLRATKKLLAKQNKTVNNQLFLFGYSQGGHATMAMHREIEQNLSNEFTVTAAAPMAGPYDVSGEQTKVLIADSSYSAPYYAPYIALGYNYVYKMYASPDEFLRSPYNATLPPLFLGNSSGGAINTAMGGLVPPPNHIFRADVLAAFIANSDPLKPTHKLRLALKDNDVYNWKPKAPMMLCHCRGDDNVSPENTRIAYDKFRDNGVPASQLTRVTPDATSAPIRHTDCALNCLLEGFAYIGNFIQ